MSSFYEITQTIEEGGTIRQILVAECNEILLAIPGDFESRRNYILRSECMKQSIVYFPSRLTFIQDKEYVNKKLATLHPQKPFHSPQYPLLSTIQIVLSSFSTRCGHSSLSHSADSWYRGIIDGQPMAIFNTGLNRFVFKYKCVNRQWGVIQKEELFQPDIFLFPKGY